MIIMIKTYSEMITFHSFEDRFEYLKMSGSIGIDTFGFDRYLNQIFTTVKNGKMLDEQLSLEIVVVISGSKVEKYHET